MIIWLFRFSIVISFTARTLRCQTRLRHSADDDIPYTVWIAFQNDNGNDSETDDSE